MKNLQTNKATSSSFLQRFEGKRSTISKEGLLHLFQAHQRKIINLPVNTRSQVKKINLDASNKEVLTQRVRDLQRLGNDSRTQKKDTSSRLSYRTEILKKQPSIDLNQKDDFVLPKISSRFSTSHQKLATHQKYDSEGRKIVINHERPQQKFHGMGKNMDENAIEHLQFLNKLESALAGLRNKNQKK